MSSVDGTGLPMREVVGFRGNSSPRVSPKPWGSILHSQPELRNGLFFSLQGPPGLPGPPGPAGPPGAVVNIKGVRWGWGQGRDLHWGVGSGHQTGLNWGQVSSWSHFSCSHFPQAVFPIPARPHCKTPVSSIESLP